MFEYKDREIYLVCGCTDMRKGIDGLSAIVSLRLACYSFKPVMFVFCNSRRDKIKVLEWDGDGFWLYQKRLEKGTFPWPKESKLQKIVLSAAEFSCLLLGTKLRRRLAFDEVLPGASA